MKDRVYLDWNATAPLRPQARDAMLEALDECGNPSSVHAAGREARRRVERARAQVGALVGCRPDDVVFTSGGTEANVLALDPSLGGSLLMSRIEHPAVRSGGRFNPQRISEISVLKQGVIEVYSLEVLLEDLIRPLVSVMLANNETGVVQPIAAVAERVHAAGGLLHVDAVQGPGRIECDFKTLGADLLTISSHKIGGPQGAGALIVRPGVRLDPMLRGGGQERGVRAGTENVAVIAGFGAAAEAVRRDGAAEARAVGALRDRLEAGLRRIAPDIVVFGADAPRLPNTILFTRRGIRAETAVIAFDLEGIAVSSGAACSSGKVAPSHVLAAMGVDPELAAGAIRMSLGCTTTEADVERTLIAWEKLSKSLYRPKKQDDRAA